MYYGLMKAPLQIIWTTLKYLYQNKNKTYLNGNVRQEWARRVFHELEIGVTQSGSPSGSPLLIPVESRFGGELKNSMETYSGDGAKNGVDSQLKKVFEGDLGIEAVTDPKVATAPTATKGREAGPILFVANHLSYLDIPLLMATIPNCAFVAKKEIARWPLFGRAARMMNTIFLDRGNSRSSQQAGQAIVSALLDDHTSVVLFPAGTTSVGHEPPWKRGAFRISKDYQIPIQPVRIKYWPHRPLVYADQDHFLTHLAHLSKISNKQAHVEFGKPFIVTDIEQDLDFTYRWCNGLNGLNPLIGQTNKDMIQEGLNVTL